MNWTVIRNLIVPGAALFLAACDSSGVCPAQIHMREPILAVTAAQSGALGAPIAEFYLSDIEINNREVPLSDLLKAPGAKGEIVGDSILCKGSCSISVYSGKYIFRVSADGYVPVNIEKDVDYLYNQKRGCKHEVYGSTAVDVRLKAQ